MAKNPVVSEHPRSKQLLYQRPAQQDVFQGELRLVPSELSPVLNIHNVRTKKQAADVIFGLKKSLTIKYPIYILWIYIRR
jgi:hypothetical protein